MPRTKTTNKNKKSRSLVVLVLIFVMLVIALPVATNSQTSCPDPCTKSQSDSKERRCDPTGKIVQECYPITGKNCYNWMAVEDCGLKGKVCSDAKCIDVPEPQTCKEAGGRCTWKCDYTEDNIGKKEDCFSDWYCCVKNPNKKTCSEIGGHCIWECKSDETDLGQMDCFSTWKCCVKGGVPSTTTTTDGVPPTACDYGSTCQSCNFNNGCVWCDTGGVTGMCLSSCSKCSGKCISKLSDCSGGGVTTTTTYTPTQINSCKDAEKAAGQTACEYDANDDYVIDDNEVLKAIDDWIKSKETHPTTQQMEGIKYIWEKFCILYELCSGQVYRWKFDKKCQQGCCGDTCCEDLVTTTTPTPITTQPTATQPPTSPPFTPTTSSPGTTTTTTIPYDCLQKKDCKICTQSGCSWCNWLVNFCLGDCTICNFFGGTCITNEQDCPGAPTTTTPTSVTTQPTPPEKTTTTTTTSSTTTTTIQDCGYIKIFKFNDANEDGKWDAGEVGIPTFKFKVSGQGLDIDVTTETGGIVVTNCIPVGTYKIIEQATTGWKATTPTQLDITVNKNTVSEANFGNKQIPTPKICTSDNDCEKDSFCEFSVGACKGQGECTLKPEVCSAEVKPVCGCDGKTYPNDCVRKQKGVSKLHDGVCSAVTTTTTSSTTTTTTITGFTVGSFTCKKNDGSYTCSLEYSNYVGQDVKILFLFKVAETGEIVSNSITIAKNNQQGTAEAQFFCGSGTYKVSWKAYLSSDINLENPILWCKSNEQKVITC
ncbi:MAG: hypothetical protein QW802_00550 [Candidatus Altiarchaeota archaeon]